MIDPFAGRNDRAGGLVGLGGATVASAPIAFTAFVDRAPLQRADRADAVGHLAGPTPARRSIWARISSI